MFLQIVTTVEMLLSSLFRYSKTITNINSSLNELQFYRSLSIELEIVGSSVID